MDQIMQIDIITNIVSHIESKDTLTRLARVSQAVSQVALDHLWERVDSAVLLARCMSPETWEEVETHSIVHLDGLDKIRMTKRVLAMSPEYNTGVLMGRHIERFRSYATRIRSLRVTHHSPQSQTHSLDSGEAAADTVTPHVNQQEDGVKLVTSLHASVISAWQRHSQATGPLFPNLKTLHWDMKSIEDRDLITTFLGPSLKNLTLSISDLPWDIRQDHPESGRSDVLFDSITVSSILEDTMTLSSAFNCFDLSLACRWIAGCPFDTMVHLPLERLKSFRAAEPMPLFFFHRLSRLPALEDLDILFVLEPEVSGSIQFSESCFPVLRALSLRWMTIEAVDFLLPAFRSSMSLLSLQIETSRVLNAQDTLALLQAIDKHAWAEDCEPSRSAW